MINLILGISLTLNIIFFIVLFFYFKVKLFGFKSLTRDLKSTFYSDNDLNDMLDRLWFYE